MANILICITGFKGIMYSSFELFNRLEEAGHNVTLSSPIDCTDDANIFKINYFQLPNFYKNFVLSNRLFDKIKFKVDLKFRSKKLFQEKINNLKFEELTKVFSERKIDLLICDIELHEVLLAAFHLKLNTILLSPFFNHYKRLESPPLLSLSNNKEKKDFTDEWLSLENKRKEKYIKELRYQKKVSRKEALLFKASEIGFPKEVWQQNLWPHPFYYTKYPTISLTMSELEFEESKHFNFYYVGPMVFEKRINMEEKFSNLKYLEKKKQSGSKVIVFTLSSMLKSEEKVISRLKAIAKNHKDWEIIINDPDHKNEKEMPDNLHIYDWLPQMQLLNIADLSINEGGINTNNECIHYKTPMLIISAGYNDQNGNTARFDYHGIGKKTSLENLEDDIKEIFNQKKYDNKIKFFNRKYINYKEEKTLEKLIIKSLENPNFIN